jgi:hypothetical protein
MGRQRVTSKGPGAKPGRFFLVNAILAGVLGLIFASPIGHIIYVAAMMSGIGIPIALVVAAIPTIALVVVAGYLIWRFVPPFRQWTAAISLAAACLLLVIIPPAHNAEIKAQVADLTSSDAGRPSGPEDLSVKAGQALALISKRSRPSLCDQICLHLLMSGEASRVLMVPLADDEAAPDPAMRAFGYILEPRADCPSPGSGDTGARPHAQNFREKTPGTISGRYATLLEQGYCLDATEATLGEADLAFMVLDQRDFPVPSTFSPVAAGTRASRAGVYAPSAQGKLAPVWQQTPVSYSLLGPVLMTTINVSAGLSGTSTGWWRDRFETGQHEFGTLSKLIRASGISVPAELR